MATEYGLGVAVERMRSPILKREETLLPFSTCISSRVLGATSAGSHSTPVTPQISTWDGAIVGLRPVNLSDLSPRFGVRAFTPDLFQDGGSSMRHRDPVVKEL